MQGAGRSLEAAEAFEEQERQRRIQQISAGLKRPGESECTDCGEVIDPRRRAAMPSARRCLACQTSSERSTR